MDTHLSERRLIDSLITKRQQFIDVYLSSVRLQRQALAISASIDDSVKSGDADGSNSFDLVFYNLAKSLGEVGIHKSLPRFSNLTRLSEEQLTLAVTRVVDNRMWELLFQRLGFYSLMSHSQITEFQHTVANAPPAFDINTVVDTLHYYYRHRDGMLISALMETLSELPDYVCNDKTKFTAKFTVSDAFYTFNDGYRLDSPSQLQRILNFIWHIILVNEISVDGGGVVASRLWDALSDAVERCSDIADLYDLDVMGIRFRFFKKRSVHVALPQHIADGLNDSLSKTRALKHA